MSNFFLFSWNVRNSSLMCFNHLINRAIPHVGKNDSSSSNAITSTVFFSRYPKLRDYLHLLTKEVKTSSNVRILIKIEYFYFSTVETSSKPLSSTFIVVKIKSSC